MRTDNYDGADAKRREHPCRRRGPQASIENHALERTGAVRATGCEERIVHQHGFRPDAERVDLGALTMNEPTGCRAGERRTHRRPRRDAAVKAQRCFQDHQRPMPADAGEESLVLSGRLVPQDADRDVDAVLAQVAQAVAVDERIRILDRDHGAPDA